MTALAMGVNILVVDDASAASQAFRDALAAAGFEVLWAASNADARRLREAHAIALALVSTGVPGVDWQALERDLSSPSGPEANEPVPLMLLAAPAEVASEAFAAGLLATTDVLCRPVAPRLLLNKLHARVALQREQCARDARHAELERLAHLNGLMTGALLHDIRTPLSVMALNAELVIRKSEAPALRQAGTRIKMAIAMLGLQAEHFVNLAITPSADLRPVPAPVDVAWIARERVDAARLETGSAALVAPVELQTQGTTTGPFDAALLGEAIDHLLRLTRLRETGRQVEVQVDGTSRHALFIRVTADGVVDEAARGRLLLAERIARAHGGSLVTRARAGEPTLFEMMLPRCVG